MADVRTTHEIDRRQEIDRRHRKHHTGLALFAFLVFLVVAAVFVAAVMNLHGSISWPAGQIDFGLSSPLPQAEPSNP